MSYVRWINAHFLPVPCCTLGLSQLFTLVLFIHFLPSSRRRTVGRWLPLKKLLTGASAGVHVLFVVLSRAALCLRFGSVFCLSNLLITVLLLSMFTGNPLFNLQLEPYRRLSCFCIIFVCPFNKHLLATSTHIPVDRENFTELTFLRR